MTRGRTRCEGRDTKRFDGDRGATRGAAYGKRVTDESDGVSGASGSGSAVHAGRSHAR